jgi:hypothetical protein
MNEAEKNKLKQSLLETRQEVATLLQKQDQLTQLVEQKVCEIDGVSFFRKYLNLTRHVRESAY